MPRTAAWLHGALTASVGADSGLLSTAVTFTDASPPIPSHCRLSGTSSFRAFREITQHHFNVDELDMEPRTVIHVKRAKRFDPMG